MTLDADTEKARAIANRLTHELPAREVWLFGSQARGDSGPDSDLDLLVVIHESDLPGYRRSRAAHSIVSDIRGPKDIVVMTRHEWRRQEHVVNTLPYLANNACRHAMRPEIGLTMYAVPDEGGEVTGRRLILISQQ